MAEQINTLENGVWTVNKCKGRGDNKEEIARIVVTGCPNEKEMLTWAVESKVLTKADLAVSLRTKMADGNTEIAWADAQTMLTEKADRKIDPDAKAIALAITTGDFSKLTDEQRKKAKAEIVKNL